MSDAIESEGYCNYAMLFRIPIGSSFYAQQAQITSTQPPPNALLTSNQKSTSRRNLPVMMKW